MQALLASLVIISEIAWAGSSVSTADEWLELWSASEAPVDIGGWRIEGAATGGGALTLPEGAAIAPGSAYLIANYGADDPKTTLATAPDWVTTAVALSNTDLYLVLRDASGAVVDEVGSASAAPAAGSTGTVRASMERSASTWITATESRGFDAGATELGTPGAHLESPPSPAPPETLVAAETPTAIETPAPRVTDARASALKISELNPRPLAGDEEWIELLNDSAMTELLEGWTLFDGRGAATALSGIALPWSRTVVRAPKGQLNDGGDLVLLKDPQGRIVDGVCYGDWECTLYPRVSGTGRGEAVIRIELSNVWAVTTAATPGAANLLVAPASATPTGPTKTDDSAVSAEAARAGTTPAAASVSAATSTAPAPMLVASTQPRALDAGLRAPIAASPPVKAKAPKPAPKSRYKGAAYEATVAVPPGIYGKTRMVVLIKDAVRTLRLTKAPTTPFEVGERLAFVAQEKRDEAGAYLLANANSLISLEEVDAPEFAARTAWPREADAASLTGTVVRSDGRDLHITIGGSEGIVMLPSAASAASLKSGDEVSVRGFVSPESPPKVYVPDETSLVLVKSYVAEAEPEQVSARSGATAMLALAATLSIFASGALAYLRNRRLQRVEALANLDETSEIA